MRMLTAKVVLVLMLFSATVSNAAVSGPPEADAYVASSSPGTVYDNTTLWVRGDTVSCNLSYESLLRWDLTDLDPSSLADHASIALRVNATTGDISQMRVTLYSVLDDSWDESSVTWSGRPALGTALEEKSAFGLIPGTIVTFTSSNLVNFLKEQADGDNTASFALVASGVCGATTNGVRFDSSETVTGVAPQLGVFTASAVGLSTSSAQRTNAPLYAAALVVLVFGLVGGAITLRRRVAVK